MTRLFFLMCALICPSLAGVGVIAVLTAGMVTLTPILIAAAAGGPCRFARGMDRDAAVAGSGLAPS